MNSTDQETWAAVDAFAAGLLVNSDPALDAAIEESVRAGLPEHQVSASQGKLLRLLAEIMGAERILELGTLGGYRQAAWLRRRGSIETRLPRSSTGAIGCMARNPARAVRVEPATRLPVLAAIELALEPYDPARVHGHVLQLPSIQRMLSQLASTPLAQRVKIPGLHSERVPTVVAGVVILIETMRAFGLERIRVSEHDILYGAAISLAASRTRGPPAKPQREP